eukprot:scaffold10280_cov64-Phaeocystis_antarctica.AAC.6
MFSLGRLFGGVGVQSRPGQSRHQLPATPNFQKEQGHSASSFCPQHAAAHSSALATSTFTIVPATSTAGGLPSANVRGGSAGGDGGTGGGEGGMGAEGGIGGVGGMICLYTLSEVMLNIAFSRSSASCRSSVT